MSSTNLSMQPQFGKDMGLHSKHRRVILTALAALLILALVLTIRGVSATNSADQQTNNLQPTPAVSANEQGANMDQADNAAGNGSSASSQSVSSQVNTSTDSNGQSSTSVMINGKPVAIPASGEVHKTITDGNGTTQVDISNGASGNSSSTSVNVQVNGSSSSSSE